MMGLNEVLFVAAVAILVQFVAAILGPRALHIASVLIILAAGGLALYLANLALNADFAGPQVALKVQRVGVDDPRH